MDKKKRDDVTTARRYKIFIERPEGGRGTGRGSGCNIQVEPSNQ